MDARMCAASLQSRQNGVDISVNDHAVQVPALVLRALLRGERGVTMKRILLTLLAIVALVLFASIAT
ncbi:MAG TPA: hypothetical protein VMT82_11465, partial [candidate division Zixibacteria bacterium]|nr:hypothetical protein [candidate division Zixibacteria bacterium]